MIAAVVGGAFVGGRMVGIVPRAMVKVGLGLILNWSAYRMWRKLSRAIRDDQTL